MRAFDRDLIRGEHYGQRSCEPHSTGRTHGCTDQCCIREESSCQPGAVHTWPKADLKASALMSANGGNKADVIREPPNVASPNDPKQSSASGRSHCRLVRHSLLPTA